MKDIATLKSLPLLLCLLLFAPTISDAQKPELVVQTGHSNRVGPVAFSPDSKMLASGSADNTIKLWDIATGTQLRSLDGHTMEIGSIAFSPDSKLLASGSSDRTIRLWDVTTGKQLHSLARHSNWVSSVAFSPNGKTLASGSADNTIKLWDVASGTQLHSFYVPALSAGSGSIITVAFSPDGKLLASDNGHTFEVRDVATGIQLHSFDHSDAIVSAAFSPDWKLLATGGYDQIIKLWDVATGKLLYSREGHTAPVSSVTFSSDGKMLASSSDIEIKLWDVATGTQLRPPYLLTPPISPDTTTEVSADVSQVAFSPDGKMLASGSDERTIKVLHGSYNTTRLNHTVKLWDVASGIQLRSFDGHASSISSVAFSPDGKILASSDSSSEHRLKLWDVVTGMQLRSLDAEGLWVKVVFSPDGKRLASTSNDTVELWDVATGTQLRSLQRNAVPQSIILSIAFSPDGKILASGSPFGALKLWNVATGIQLSSLEGHSGSVVSVAFSPDGKLLASGSEDGTSKLWDVATGKQLRSLDVLAPSTVRGAVTSVKAVIFSPDSKLLASGSTGYTVKLWDVATGKQLHSLDAQNQIINAIAFSPNGKMLVSGSSSSENAISLWDVATGKQLRSFGEHISSINAVAFSPDSKMLVSSSDAATTKLWDTESGQELASLISLDKADWLVVTPDGLFDGSNAAWGKMIWRASQNTFDYAPVEAYFGDYYYPGLLGDIYAGKRPQAPTKIEDRDRRQPQVEILGAEPLDWSDPRVKDQDRSHFYMHVTLEVTEAAANREHKPGSGARDVRLFRDGTLVKIWHGDMLGGGSSVKLEADVPVLPDENHFTAYAFNHDNIKSRDATLYARGDQTLRGQQPLVRTAYVLTVGINAYANEQFNLKYAVADAQDFGAEWQRQQQSLKQFQRVEVVSLLDDEATKANIMLAIKRLVELQPAPLPAGAPHQLVRLKYAEPQDAVLVYFAGHGTAAGNRFYLIPHDLGYAGKREEVTEDGLQGLLAHSISDLELEQAFEGLQSGQQVFVIDACNSGQALEAEEKRRGPMNSKGLAQLAYEKGMYILTAAQSFQAAQEASQLGHGLLTYALIEEGLKTASADKEPADGQVTLREWLDFATERVPQMQIEKIRQANGRGLHLSFVEGEERGLCGSFGCGAVQRPHVFYRREIEPQVLIVAKTDARATPQSPHP